LYINGIEYFPQTNEFYVFVPFKNSRTDFESLSSKADSVVFKDEETLRSRLPMRIAMENFDLSLMDTLTVFDYSHKLVTGIKFERVEYFSPNIESGFIAVFKPDESNYKTDQEFYCLGPLSVKLNPVKTKFLVDDALTQQIKNDLRIEVQYQWEVKHVKLLETNTILSVFSCDEKNGSRSASYLTEIKDGKLRLLNKYNEEYAFWDILPLPISINNMPVLLITMAIPETDAGLCYVPFVYEDSGYKLSETNRIKL